MQFNPVYNKTPRGASVEGEEVSFTLALSYEAKEVRMLIKKDEWTDFASYPMFKNENGQYELRHTFDRGLFWYYFEVETQNEVITYGQNVRFNAEKQTENVSHFAQVVTKAMDSKKSLGIIYHVFVDRFCKEGEVEARPCFIKRDDWGGKIDKNTSDTVELNKEVFCGNLQGVISKLDYIKSLGVETIYLSPISYSNSYHKYDTASYFDVDPMFGGDEVFRDLVKKAKKKRMNIIIDGVFNHTGSDSIYFNKNGTFNSVGAYNSKDSRYFDWYNFSEWPDKYDCWWDVPTLPAVNESSSFVKYITGKNGVLEKWLSFGIKGVRLDVVDELTDNFIDRISSKVRSYGKDKILLGEVWEDASTKIAYDVRRRYFIDDQFDSVMNYPMKNGIISYICSGDETEYVNSVHMLLDHYPKKALYHLMNLIGTHDSMRIGTVIKNVTEDESQKMKLLKIATILQFGFLGCPAIFYGDERGVLGEEAPLCRECFPWEKEKTKSEKWYKFLGKLRKKEVLRNGDYQLIHAKNGVIVFKRSLGKEEYIFVTNLSPAPYYLQIFGAFDILNKKEVQNGIGVEPNDVAILYIQGEEND